MTTKLFRIHFNAEAGDGGGGGAPANGGTGSASLLSGSQGGGNDPGSPTDWRATLPEDLRGDPSLKDIKDVSGLAKSFVSQGKLIGAARLEAPNEKWGDKEWEAFYGKIGRPADVKGYKIERPANLPKGVTYDEGLEKEALDTFHKAGLNPRQAKALLDWHNGRTLKGAEAAVAARDKAYGESVASLQKELGENYKPTVVLAKTALRTLGDGKDTLTQKLVAAGLDNDPDIVKAFAKAGRLLGEDKAGAASNMGLMTSAESADSEITKLRGDTEFLKAYNSTGHPGHKAARDRMAQLYKIKNSK